MKKAPIEYDLPIPVYAGKKKPTLKDIQQIFNPFQRAPENSKDLSRDKLKKFPFITVIGGYHNILSHDKETNVLQYFAPNIALIVAPPIADKAHQHFGLGTYVTNPFAPIASLLMFALRSLDKDNNVGFGFLLLPTVPIVVLALLIDAIKMLITYVALAIPAAVALPIMNYMDKKDRLSHMEHGFYGPTGGAGAGAGGEDEEYHYAGRMDY